jgi:hypothetical protein
MMLVTILVAGAFAVAVTAGLDAFFSIGGRNIGPAFRWFVIGAVLASVPWTVWSAVTQADGSWAWRTGADAERWTAAALRHLGHDWHFHYDVVFYGGKIEDKSWVSDIDCVAIGPGGIFCVSTKWTSDPWDLDNPEDDWLVAAAAQAARNAGRLTGPAHQAVPKAKLTPVVVCWGPQLGPVKEVVSKVRAHGTEAWVVYGPQYRQWLETLRGTCLGKDQVAQLDQVVGGWVLGYEDRSGRTPAARSLAEAAARRARVASLAAAVVSALAVAWLTSAEVDRSLVRAFDSFVSFGHGAVGIVYVLLPIVLSATSAALAYRGRLATKRARMKSRCRAHLIVSLASFLAWPLALLAAWAAG